jgi:hypothetical protein
VVRDFLNVRVNQNAQVTDASVKKMECCAIVGAIALDHVMYQKNRKYKRVQFTSLFEVC